MECIWPNIVCSIDIDTTLNQKLCESINWIWKIMTQTKNHWVAVNLPTTPGFPFNVARCNAVRWLLSRCILWVQICICFILSKRRGLKICEYLRVSTILDKQMSNLFVSLFCGPHQARNSIIVHSINAVLIDQIVNLFNISCKKFSEWLLFFTILGVFFYFIFIFAHTVYF